MKKRATQPILSCSKLRKYFILTFFKFLITFKSIKDNTPQKVFISVNEFATQNIQFKIQFKKLYFKNVLRLYHYTKDIKTFYRNKVYIQCKCLFCQKLNILCSICTTIQRNSLYFHRNLVNIKYHTIHWNMLYSHWLTFQLKNC